MMLVATGRWCPRYHVVPLPVPFCYYLGSGLDVCGTGRTWSGRIYRLPALLLVACLILKRRL